MDKQKATEQIAEILAEIDRLYEKAREIGVDNQINFKHTHTNGMTVDFGWHGSNCYGDPNWRGY